MAKPEPAEVLAEFVSDINLTGGVYLDKKGLHHPVADPDWIDLAETYLKACQAIGKKPTIVEGDEDELAEGGFGEAMDELNEATRLVTEEMEAEPAAVPLLKPGQTVTVFPPNSKLVRVHLTALTSHGWSGIVAVPQETTDEQIDELVSKLWDEDIVDGSQFELDGGWERGDSCGWEPCTHEPAVTLDYVATLDEDNEWFVQATDSEQRSEK